MIRSSSNTSSLQKRRSVRNANCTMLFVGLKADLTTKPILTGRKARRGNAPNVTRLLQKALPILGINSARIAGLQSLSAQSSVLVVAHNPSRPPIFVILSLSQK
jgi:hypothetical protein